MSFKLLAAIFAVAIVALIGGAAYFLSKSPADVQGLAVNMDIPANVPIGSPFEVKITVVNNSRNGIKDAKLSLELPKDVVFLESGSEKRVESRDLGALNSQSISEERFKLLALQGENTIKEIKAAVSYIPVNVGSRFEKKQSGSIEVSGPTVSVDFDMPSKIYNGEDLEINLTYKNNSDEDMHDIRLKIEYPATFIFKESSLAPTTGNNTWTLSEIKKDSETKFLIKGSMKGPDNAIGDFKVSLEKNFSGETYKISEKIGRLEIIGSPLAVTIIPNGNPNAVVRLGDGITYTIRYKNMTNIGLQDVIIKARPVASPLFDMTTIRSSGTFRSLDNSVVWTAANEKGLAFLAPNASGEVSFSVSIKRDYPLRRLSDKNFIVRAEAEVESPTVPPFISAARTIGVASAETKVGGDFKFEAKIYHSDPDSGITNSGPYPPKVNTPTQFTVHWIITTYNTDVRDITMSTFLRGNTHFTGVIKSNASSSVPEFNDREQSIKWNIPAVSSATGILREPLEAIFQIEFIPSTQDIGENSILVEGMEVKAVDDFTGLNYSRGSGELTTRTVDGQKVGQSGQVVP